MAQFIAPGVGPGGKGRDRAHQGDLLAEHTAVRQAAGLLDRSGRGRIILRGADRATFLHGLLTNEVARIAPGQSVYGLFLTVKGKVAADMHVHALEDRLLLDMEGANREKVWEILDQYLILEDVALEDATEELTCLSVHGPRARAVVGQALGAAFAHVQPGTVAAVDQTAVAGVEYLGEEGFDCFVPAERGEATRQALVEAGARPVGPEAAEILRVEAGVPRYGPDFDEDVLPMEANLEQAVSFTKGCFPGAEVLSRLHLRGHVNRALWGLDLGSQSPPSQGAEVWAAGRRSGRVTSAVHSAMLGRTIALAYVRRDHAAPGAEVAVQDGEQRLKASVRELPFYRRGASRLG